MPRLIEQPTVIQAVGNKPKRIEEFIGRVNSGHEALSVARMVSPGGWVEPGQRPEFHLVLRATLRVEHEGGALEVHTGQAIVTNPGEWVCYSTPDPDGAEYIAVCLPAFSPATVHRDEKPSMSPEEIRSMLERWQKHFEGRKLTPSADLIREDRER